jgi:choline kinase/phosphatidylglycerophosphate synthase
MSILSQYRSSLKHPAAEELLDLWIYRPIAFVLARILVRTDVTPNQITGAALVSSVVAAVAFTTGSRVGFISGAMLYALSNVLDCCDGMVARLKRNGTQLGRMVDVFADTVSGVLIYIGIGVGLARADAAIPISPWLLVCIGGASFALQSALFDRQRNRFLSRIEGAGRGIEGEIVAVAATTAVNGSLLLRLLSRAYIRYMRWQRNGVDDDPIDARTLRLWSITGSTTHVTVVVTTMLIGQPLALFVYTMLLANVWCAALLLRGRRRARRVAIAAEPVLRLIRSDATARVRPEIIAVLLAAGTGTRLRPLTDDIPKPLVEVGGVALLGRSIDALVAAGVRRFVVVAGYRASRVETYLDLHYPTLDVELIYNRRFDESNNAASALLAARAFDGERMLLLDGDLLYDPAIIEELVAIDPRESRLVVRASNELGEEEVKVMVGRDGRIDRIGKTLAPRACVGESIGIALFDARTTARFFRTLEYRLMLPGGRDEFYEASFQQMIDEGVDLRPFDANGRVCIEIDTLEDHAEAERLAGVGALLSAHPS